MKTAKKDYTKADLKKSNDLMPKKMEISNDVRNAMGSINQDIVDFDGTGKDMPIKIDDSELNRAGVKNGSDYIIPVTDDSPGFKTKEERDEINKRWDYLEKNFSDTNSMQKYNELKDKTQVINNNIKTCLLYTSDAADE